MSKAFTKFDDLIESKYTNLIVDYSPFLGKWKNTKATSGQIPKIEIVLEDNQLILHAFGAGLERLIDWGKVPC